MKRQNLAFPISKANVTIGDGTCVLEFDQTEKGSIISDESTGLKMNLAASDLLKKCSSVQARDRGGIATGLGKFTDGHTARDLGIVTKDS